MDSRTLIIRADANSRIGSGHAMRCLALAQAWQSAGGRAEFAVKHCPSGLLQRLRSAAGGIDEISAEAGTAQDALQLCDFATQCGASWIVVDGQDFGAGYQSILKQGGFKILSVVDRGSAKHQVADVILNQNIHAQPWFYPHREHDTQLLLGTQFALLRKEFLAWQQWTRKIRQQSQRVLVTMGGADPESLTQQVVSSLVKSEFRGLEMIVLAGAVNEHSKGLATFAQEAHFKLRVLRNVNNMPELMAWADVAVVAGGGTLWELLYMQVPVISYAIQTVQQAALSVLSTSAAVIRMGRPPVREQDLVDCLRSLFDDPATRSRMANAGRTIVDGGGAMRVAQKLQSRLEMDNVKRNSERHRDENDLSDRGARVYTHGRTALP